MDRTRDPKRDIPESPATFLFIRNLLQEIKMNRQEYINSKISRKNPEYKYVHKLLREWKIANNITENCVTHHRDDTEETRKYNEEHYELWGFDENGNFIEGKYVVFMTNSEHTSYHHKGMTHTEEVRQRLSKSHTGKILSEEHKRKISEGNKGIVRTNVHRDHYRSARQKFSALYTQYKENGGTLKWNDFCHAAKKGDIELNAKVGNDKESENG